MSTDTALPPILALPSELHLAIASHLPWWDVYSLRLVCRQMHTLLPPLTTLPKYKHFEQNWWKDPLTASFLVQSNNLNVCTHCPTIENATEAPFTAWYEQGLYVHEKRCRVRQFPHRAPEVWSLCDKCDKSLQDDQSNNWCCAWKKGEPACNRCNPHMRRITPGTSAEAISTLISTIQ